MTDDVGNWIIAGLQMVAALAIAVFWLTWPSKPHDEEWLPAGYVQHEEVFMFPDWVLAIVLVASAILQVLEEPLGVSLALVAAGGLTFLGVIDLAYFAKHGMFRADRGGLMNAGVVTGALLLAVILIVRFA